MTTTPTMNLRWRIATHDDIYKLHLPLAMQNGIHYVLEQQYRLDFTKSESKFEWYPVDTEEPDTPISDIDMIKILKSKFVHSQDYDLASRMRDCEKILMKKTASPQTQKTEIISDAELIKLLKEKVVQSQNYHLVPLIREWEKVIDATLKIPPTGENLNVDQQNASPK